MNIYIYFAKVAVPERGPVHAALHGADDDPAALHDDREQPGGGGGEPPPRPPARQPHRHPGRLGGAGRGQPRHHGQGVDIE